MVVEVSEASAMEEANVFISAPALVLRILSRLTRVEEEFEFGDEVLEEFKSFGKKFESESECMK